MPPSAPPPSTLLAATCVLQFLVWFKPSEQYFIDVVPARFHVSVEEVTGVLFVHSLYAPFLVFPLLTAAYRVGGYATALTLTTLAAAASPALILLGAPHFACAVASQWTWALHFAALFATVGMLYSWLPPDWYLPAAAANTATMLAASTASAAVGLGMVRGAGVPMEATFSVTLASALGGVVWLGVCVVGGWLPPPTNNPRPTLPCLSRRSRGQPLLPLQVGAPPIPPQTCKPPPAMRALLTVPRIWRWLLPALMLRGTHTLVLELWPALSFTAFPSLQPWNAAVGLAAQMAAAVAVALACRLQALRSTRASQYVLVAATSACSLMLFLLGLTAPAPGTGGPSGMVWLAVLVAGQNLAAEIALAIASAATAKEVFRVLNASQPQPQDGATIIGTLGGGEWALVLGVQALLGEAWQLTAQFTLWPHGVWPMEENPWGMHLTYAQQFCGLGAFAAIAAVTALALHGVPVELLAARSGGCLCCRPEVAEQEESEPPKRAHLLEDALCPGAWVWFARDGS